MYHLSTIIVIDANDTTDTGIDLTRTQGQAMAVCLAITPEQARI